MYFKHKQKEQSCMDIAYIWKSKPSFGMTTLDSFSLNLSLSCAAKFPGVLLYPLHTGNLVSIQKKGGIQCSSELYKP